MKDKLIQVIKDAHDNYEHRFDPEMFIDSKRMSEEGMLLVKSVLGNMYIKGYSEQSEKNFEVLKDSDHYRVRIWAFDTNKPKDFTVVFGSNEIDVVLKYLEDVM